MHISFQIADYLNTPRELRSNPHGLLLRSGKVVSKRPLLVEKKELFAQLRSYLLQPTKKQSASKQIESLGPSIDLLGPSVRRQAVKTTLSQTKRPLFEQLQSITAILGKEKTDTFLQEMVAEKMVSTVTKIAAKKESEKGLWYPSEYSRFLKGKMPVEYWTGHANPEFFEKPTPCHFRLKTGKKASEAIRNFMAGPTIVDCGNFIAACYYNCLLDLLGDALFDAIFSSDPYRLEISQEGIGEDSDPLRFFGDFAECTKNEVKGKMGARPLEIGQECHFEGITWYYSKHPNGFHKGENVIYVGKNKEGLQLFLGLGFVKPMTEEEIYTMLLMKYNEERDARDLLRISKSIDPWQYCKNHNCDLKMWYTIPVKNEKEAIDQLMGGYSAGTPRGLVASKIRAIVEKFTQ